MSNTEAAGWQGLRPEVSRTELQMAPGFTLTYDMLRYITYQRSGQRTAYISDHMLNTPSTYYGKSLVVLYNLYYVK